MRRKIFTVLGVMPEPGGFAAAKFSRTATYKSYQDWVMELTEEGAEKFYTSFYFQYGHASIADLAHVMVIFENISMPARHLLLDDQLIDVQSRSTRYVDYSKAVFITPPEIKKDKPILKIYNKMIKELISFYSFLCPRVGEYYAKKYADQRPGKMTDEEYLRTIRARSFDVARYLLPSCSPKSMGIIASGRTWERIINKFLGSPLMEFQQIGKQLQAALCKREAFNPALIKLNNLKWLSQKQKKEIKNLVTGRNIALPTLVKFAARNDYPENAYEAVKKLVPQLKIKEKPDGCRGVAMFERVSPSWDFVASLFYRVSPYSYGQIIQALKGMSENFIDDVLDLVYRFRQEHDFVLKEAGTASLIFDICMDIGGFRDLHRHRNCVHILKEPSPEYGFDMPEEIVTLGLRGEYESLIERTKEVYSVIENKYPNVGQYILPQATRRRFLMKISPWELQYIAELRSRPQGHFSYREISFLMYQEFAKKYPDWAKNFKVTNPKVVDFFKR